MPLFFGQIGTVKPCVASVRYGRGLPAQRYNTSGIVISTVPKGWRGWVKLEIKSHAASLWHLLKFKAVQALS